MLTFKSFIQTTKNLVSKIRDKVLGLLTKLKFGKKVKIKLTSPRNMTEAVEKKADLKSRMGYYSELCVAESLTRQIAVNVPKNIKGNSLRKIISLREQYAKNNLVDDNIAWNRKVDISHIKQEKTRQEESGKHLADQIWDDIQDSIDDILYTDFEILLVGESGKGETKADVTLVVSKKDTNEVVRKIEASLKAYKSWSINLSNSTFTSFLVNLIEPEMGGFSSKGAVADKMKLFVDKHGNSRQVKRLVDLQKYGPNIKRTKGRAVAKKSVDDTQVYKEARNIIIDIFEDVYKKNKTQINMNMLKLLGFDGTDELYLAVQSSAGKNVEVLSSNQSTEFKKILDQLNKDFRIVFEKSDRIVNTPIRFYSGNTLLFKANFAFRDLDKISVFVNLKKWK